MSKAATVKLTSEQRCQRAFDEWYYDDIREWYESAAGDARDNEDVRAAMAWVAWSHCWRYLESRVTEFVQS